jgi:hypothetical protein
MGVLIDHLITLLWAFLAWQWKWGLGYGVIFSMTDDFSFSIEIRLHGLSRFGAKRLHTEAGTMGGDSYSIHRF